MDWLKEILPHVVALLERLGSDFYSPTAPPPAPTVVPPGTVAQPDEVIKLLQHLLNAVPGVKPIDEDGWIGPDTRDAIVTAAAYAKSWGLG